MKNEIEIYHHSLASGIGRTPKFAEKKLADFAINVGLKCAHSCTYCSSGVSLRCHPAFKTVGRSPFESGYAIVDPDMPKKVAADAARIRKPGMVQLCTTVDAWCPAAQQYNLGRRCLEAILAEPGWTVRILTKNGAVAADFDLVQKHRDRVLVGLSLTGTPDQEDVVAAVEPNASPLSERFAALRDAHALGLRTYAMFCPLLPGIADAPEQIDRLVRFAKTCGAEEVFVEAVNPRGSGLGNTENALRSGGFEAEADAVAAIRERNNWSTYVAGLVTNVQAAMRKHGMMPKLRFLQYPTGLSDADRRRIGQDDEGVIWLG